MRVCLLVVVFLACAAWAPPAGAHRLEPISTEFARPFKPWAGGFQFNYEYERRGASRSHLFPATEFELGIFPRTQLSLEMPLRYEKTVGEPATWTGGHLGIAVRYLIAGGEDRTFAVAVNPFVEFPTGNRRVTGDAKEAGVLLHVDKEFGARAFFHGNYGWSTTIGGSEERERTFLYRSALVVPVSHRWNPALELLGQTDVSTGRTEFVVQPEIIYYGSPHWELKLGIPLGTTGLSPSLGVRAQVTWIFGKHGSD